MTQPNQISSSLEQVLRELAAGRSVAAADYERIAALCRRADAERGAAPAGAAEATTQTVKTCSRCRLMTRHIYCPGCGERV